MKQLTITRDVYDLMPLASKDESRYNIVAISLEADKAIATDGHMLGVLNLETEVCDGHAKRLIKFQPSKVKKNEACLPEFFAETNGCPTGVSQTGTRAEEIDGEYPDWKIVFPKADEKPVTSINLDLELLTKLGKFLTAKEANKFIRIELYEDGKPAVLTGQGSERLGLIMPVREDAILHDASDLIKHLVK